MASASPSPNSSVPAVPPAAFNSPPPLPSPPSPPLEQPTPPPPAPVSPSSQPSGTSPGSPPLPSALPPESPPNTPSPPPVSPPPMASSAPPSVTSPPPQSSPPPPDVTSPTSSSPPPRPSSPPPSSPPPPSDPPGQPPPSSSNPPRGSPRPPSSTPPTNSPPPPLPPKPPESSPPPPSSEPPRSSPPPALAEPPQGSPPAPSLPRPPQGSPPPPALPRPPQGSPPPPPLPEPPQGSPPSPPPPPASDPPQNSPPSPVLRPPSNSTPPPISSTPPSRSPPSPGSPRLSPPPPTAQLSPPPSLGSRPSPSPPSPSLVSPDAPTTNTSNSNAPDSSNSTGGGGIGTGAVVAIGLVVTFLLLGVIGTAVCCLWKRKKKVPGPSPGYIMPTSRGSSPKSEPALLSVQVSAPNAGSDSGRGFGSSPSEPGGLGNSKSWFTYEELAEATNGFSVQNLLGEGGFGSVYKGCLSDGTEVAVKQLKVGGGQGDREFRAEVEIISRVHHRHLVSLVGYCISENRRLLVYDYVPNNTLYFHLHGEGRPVLDWAARVKIAVGAARGIAYLHEDCHPRIIHRDIKSSNILLDNNFEARVSDFGLAKLIMDSNTHVSTRVMGTFGYMAPEYASSGKLTEKSDVFSFGVVLLELITGRKPVDTSQPLGDESLVEWARPLLSHALDTDEFEALVDPRLEKTYVGSQMFRMIEAAAACVRHSSAKRPRMIQVVRAFDDMSTTDLTNGMKVGESEMFNSAQQSAEIRLFRRMAFGSQNYSTEFFSQASRNGEEVKSLDSNVFTSRGFAQRN